MTVKFIVADENTLIRRGVRAIVQAIDTLPTDPNIRLTFSLVAEARSTADLLDLIALHAPDILLLGYTLNPAAGPNPLSGMDGLALVKGLRQKFPALKIILFAPYTSPQLIRMAMEAGANAYVSRNINEKCLRDAMNAVMNGEVYIEPVLMKLLLQGGKLAGEALSPREIDVLRLMCRGLSLTDISTRMHISIKTVSAHKIRAMEKLRVENDCELYCLLARTRMFDIAI